VKAIAALTRAIGETDNDRERHEAVVERRAMREELDALRRARVPENVIAFDADCRRRDP
jgi:hypothetical protein